MNFLNEGLFLLKILGVAVIITYFLDLKIKHIFIFFLAYSIYVFRYEKRYPPVESIYITSVCDGKITDITNEIVKGKQFTKITITNDLLDAKFLLAPDEGELKIEHESEGNFECKMNEILIKHETYNNNIVIEKFGINFLNHDLKSKKKFKQGEKYGSFYYIKCVNVYIPNPEIQKILVQKGQKVIAGETAIYRK